MHKISLVEPQWWVDLLRKWQDIQAKYWWISDLAPIFSDVFVFIYPIFLICVYIHAIIKRRKMQKQWALYIFFSVRIACKRLRITSRIFIRVISVERSTGQCLILEIIKFYYFIYVFKILFLFGIILSFMDNKRKRPYRCKDQIIVSVVFLFPHSLRESYKNIRSHKYSGEQCQSNFVHRWLFYYLFSI